MPTPEKERLALATVANLYVKCCEENPLSPKSFVGLTQAFIRYYHTQNPKYAITERLLDCKAWVYTEELADALRPIMDIYNAQFMKRCHLDYRKSALLDSSACVAILMNGSQAIQSSRHELLKVTSGRLQDFEDVSKSLLGCNASIREQLLSMIVSTYTTLPIMAKQRTVDCLLHCLEDTRRCADCLQVEPSGNVARDSMISDLRNAFRGQFYESRNESGLSSLDRLNLSLRANLFMSHYSIVVRRDRSVSVPGQGLPFYPYMALVQSSGSGKSRLLREVGKTLPLVYGNLNAADSKGYPFPNNSLRMFLLWQGDSAREAAEAASDQCEKRCETLLLVTVMVFYLMFSSRDDERKKLLMPSKELLEKKVEERVWQTVGICERDVDPVGESLQSKGDFFWDVVLTVTERLMYPRANGSTDHRKRNCTGLGSLKREDQLLYLEDLLHEFGESVLSPKYKTRSMSEIWDKSPTLTPKAESNRCRQLMRVTESQSNTQLYSSRCGSREEALDLLQSYLDIRMLTMKETLPEIARSLQQLNSQKSLDVLNSPGLCALFLAFDESRCLTTCTVRNNRAFRRDKERDSAVSVFRCLRRVLRNMYEKNGVSLFMIFSDTVAKLANFVPQPSRDPSARMMFDGEGREHPGQMFSPFIALGTESAGVMLAESGSFNFRQRMEAFCATWGSPNVQSGSESVTEEVTSFPSELLRGQLRANRTVCKRSENGEVIFLSDDDYVYLGRPLWASTIIHNQKGASWHHMVMFALEKLLGGDCSLSEDSSIYVKQCLAALGCRLPLQFVEYSGIAPQLIAEHMAWCMNVSWDRECVYLRYMNEPLLATAAAVLWDKELAAMLQCLVARCGTFVSNKGDLGEVAACVLLTVAMDSAYKDRDMKGVSEDVSKGSDEGTPSPAKMQYEDKLKHLPKGLTMFGVVTVKEFLESGFTLRVVTDFKRNNLRPIEDPKTGHLVGYAWISEAGEAPLPQSESLVFVPEMLAAAQIRFKSIKRINAAVGCRDIPFLFEANLAVLAQRKQKGIDILIPVRVRIPCGEDKHQTKWSCLTVQVKNRRRSARVSTVAGKNLDPKFTEAVHCDVNERKDCDRCSWMRENHFGIALNVYDGATPENERVYGPLWTFISSHSERDARKNNQDSHPIAKKRRLNGDPGYGEEDALFEGGPRSANLIVNGFCGEAAADPRVRCSLEVLRQLEVLVAQDSLSGIVHRKAQQEVKAVQEVLAAASKEDKRNFKLLEESGILITGLARDLEKSIARMN